MTITELYLQHEGAIYHSVQEAMGELGHKLRVSAARDKNIRLPIEAARLQAAELMFMYLSELGEFLPKVTHGKCVCGAPCAFINKQIICSMGVHNI